MAAAAGGWREIRRAAPPLGTAMAGPGRRGESGGLRPRAGRPQAGMPLGKPGVNRACHGCGASAGSESSEVGSRNRATGAQGCGLAKGGITNPPFRVSLIVKCRRPRWRGPAVPPGRFRAGTCGWSGCAIRSAALYASVASLDRDSPSVRWRWPLLVALVTSSVSGVARATRPAKYQRRLSDHLEGRSPQRPPRMLASSGRV